MTNSINFAVLYAAAARLVVTKNHLSYNIVNLLCRYEQANDTESAIKVANKLLNVICDEYVPDTEHSYYKMLITDGLEGMMVTPMHPSVIRWLQSEYRYLITK